MAGARQLLRAGEPGRARTDDRHAPAAARAGGLRDDPALVPGAVHDRDLDLLDRHGVALVDLEHARGLARRGAEAARELGEVVRPVELLDRLAPAVAVDEVVPLRDQVPERAAVVAERDTALHAARALLLQHRQLDRAHELAEVADPLARIALRLLDPLVLEEAAELAHQAASSDSVVRNPLPVEVGLSPFGSIVEVVERALVVVRHHLDELRHGARPVLEQPLGDGGAGAREVLLHERAQLVGVRRRRAPRSRPAPCCSGPGSSPSSSRT